MPASLTLTSVSLTGVPTNQHGAEHAGFSGTANYKGQSGGVAFNYEFTFRNVMTVEAAISAGYARIVGELRTLLDAATKQSAVPPI
jgi:hypothetical protein